MAKVTKKEITTKSGLKLKIDPAIGDDMEIIDAIQGLARGAVGGLSAADIIVKMLGEPGMQAVYEHCRGENGRVSATKVGQEIDDIMNAAVELLKKA